LAGARFTFGRPALFTGLPNADFCLDGGPETPKQFVDAFNPERSSACVNSAAVCSPLRDPSNEPPTIPRAWPHCLRGNQTGNPKPNSKSSRDLGRRRAFGLSQAVCMMGCEGGSELGIDGKCRKKRGRLERKSAVDSGGHQTWLRAHSREKWGCLGRLGRRLRRRCCLGRRHGGLRVPSWPHAPDRLMATMRQIVARVPCNISCWLSGILDQRRCNAPAAAGISVQRKTCFRFLQRRLPTDRPIAERSPHKQD
jgi:hypothetical protein